MVGVGLLHGNPTVSAKSCFINPLNEQTQRFGRIQSVYPDSFQWDCRVI